MQKKIITGINARKALIDGMDQLANTIKATLGPKGRNVVIASAYMGPYITNDGATIAREFILEDAFENVGIELVKEVALKTNDLAGDGTTTATLLAQAILHQGMLYIDKGYSPIIIKESIEMAVEVAIAYLETLRVNVTDALEVENIACISSGNRIIGKMIGEAFRKTGKELLLSIEETTNQTTALEMQNGFRIDEGYISPYMVTDQTNMLTEFKDPYFIITNQRVEDIQQISGILDPLIQSQASVVLISNAIDEKLLSTLVYNTRQGVLKIVAVKAPSSHERQKEMLEDIAIATGGKVISSEFGLPFQKVCIEDLGRASKVQVSKDTTIIINGQGNLTQLEFKKQQIKNAITTATTSFEKVELENRLAKFNESAAIIKVGAKSALELKEKKMKIEDAICATKAAIQDGIVAGGGKSYLNTAKYLDAYCCSLTNQQQIGCMIISEALKQPIKQLLKNAGMKEIEGIVEEMNAANDTIGYDIYNNCFVDLFKEGIIDPYTVEKVALQSASSIAALILTTESVLVDANHDEIVKKEWNDQLLEASNGGLY